MSKAKTYILYITWGGTVNNHAGMAYLVREIKKKYPDKVKLIEVPATIGKWPNSLKRLNFHLMIFVLGYLLQPYDQVLFMEYLGVGAGDHTGIAIKLRIKHIKAKFYGIVHLSGNHLLELYGNADYIRKGAEALDTIIVLGSGLKSFFASFGFAEKIIQTFHYVDNKFYKPAIFPKLEKLQVIHIGTHKRNFKALTEIVESCPDIDFHICMGSLNLIKLFNHLPNAKLYDFIPEEEILDLMQKCHISLSVLYDTVGSNVITTSMAVGLVNVASDVGSIRDYCNSENSILCRDINEFVTGLNKINSDRSLLQKLSENSLNQSEKFSMEKSIDFFHNEILKN